MMPHFRITIRHGRPQRYHVVDVEAPDLAAATALAAQHVPAGADAGADLVEVRLQQAPAARSYVGDDRDGS
jgi:hypothetical protein